jgi:twitching motility protein PilT
MSIDLHKLLHFAAENCVSDIHLQAGVAPMLRIGGQLRVVESSPLTDQDILDFVASIATISEGASIPDRLAAGLDFSYAVPEVTRFRCSAFRQLGRPAVVMRLIRPKIPSLEDLHLPQVIGDIALSRRGLTLLTGTTGSGKSSTLAAMIDLINQNHAVKIITVEDPIEFVHANKRALISQLEVGLDTPTFAHALRQALRQNPDVILIGELRDLESLRMALQAADTGHQVFATVHSATAPQTIGRLIAMFPPAEHNLLLMQLANSLEAIISQRLLATRKDGLRPAVEILRSTPYVQKCIVENRIADLRDYLERGESGMQSFDQHILQMRREELISGTEAMRWATRPEALALAMRGVGVPATAPKATIIHSS